MVDAYFDIHGFGNLKTTKDTVDTRRYQWSTLPKYQQGIANTTERQFLCQNVNDKDGPYYFHLPSIPNQVIDGSTLRAVLLLQVESDWGPAAQWNELSVVPDIGNSLFESVQISINDEPYSDLTQEHYPYKAYLEKLLKYSHESHTTLLASSIAMPDSTLGLNKWKDEKSTANNPKVTPEIKQLNKNFWLRNAYVMGNTDCKFTVDTELHLDIFQGARYMPPGVKFDIVFHRSSPHFYIMCKEENVANSKYRIKIIDFRLEVNYITLSPELSNDVAKMRDFTIPFGKVIVHKTQFPVGYTTLLFDICRGGGGALPRQLLIGMVDTKDFHGQYESSPYVFQHYTIKEIGLIKNGVRHPIEPLTVDFTDRQQHYARAYRHFLKNIGHGERSDCQITMETYPHGHTLFAFDLSNDRSNNFHLFKPEKGTLSLEIKLSQPFTEPITLLVLGCYNKLLRVIDGEGIIEDI